MTRPGGELTTYGARGGHAKHQANPTRLSIASGNPINACTLFMPPQVKRNLIYELEVRRGYRLCIHHRDFIPGYPIDQNIADSILQSRRTILVLTSGFQHSDWCGFETKIAFRQHQPDSDSITTVIPIVFRSFDTRNATILLQTILDEHTYIEWAGNLNRALFWDAIAKSLGKPLRSRNADHSE